MNTSRRNWLALATGFLLTVPAFAAGAPKVGDKFPNLADFQLEGTLPDLKGKVVVVDLWASWCGPCKKVMPILAELHKELGDQVVILGVSLDETKADMDAYLRKAPVPFAVVRDPKSKLAEALAVNGIPTSFVLRPDGRIAAIHEGFEGAGMRKKYAAEIEAARK
ncbi:MAG: TlpA family protein disulfide reductase [Verrucomicrobiota bacterium]